MGTRLTAGLSALALAGAATGALLFTGIASADTTPPAPNTPECTALVNNTTAVQNAQAALDKANATVANDQTAYNAAVAALTAQQSVVSQLTAALGTTITNAIGGVTGLVTQDEVNQAAAAVPSRQTAVNDTLATLNADKAKAATAQNDLTSAVNSQTTALCTGTVPATTSTDPAPANDKNCSDFATQAQAQAFYLSVKTAANPDPDHLDANGNGIACEDLADGSGKVVTGTSAVPSTGGTTSIPSTSSATSSATGTTTTPDTSAGVNTGGWDE